MPLTRAKLQLSSRTSGCHIRSLLDTRLSLPYPCSGIAQSTLPVCKVCPVSCSTYQSLALLSCSIFCTSNMVHSVADTITIIEHSRPHKLNMAAPMAYKPEPVIRLVVFGGLYTPLIIGNSANANTKLAPKSTKSSQLIVIAQCDLQNQQNP